MPCIQWPLFTTLYGSPMFIKSQTCIGISWWQSSVDIIAHDFIRGDFQYLYNVINQNVTPQLMHNAARVEFVCKVSTTTLYPYWWDILYVNQTMSIATDFIGTISKFLHWISCRWERVLVRHYILMLGDGMLYNGTTQSAGTSPTRP